MGETPFALAFGTEAVIPLEIAIPSYRISQAITDNNDEAKRLDLDMLEECKLTSIHRNAAYKQRSKKYYNSKVKIRQF